MEVKGYLTRLCTSCITNGMPKNKLTEMVKVRVSPRTLARWSEAAAQSGIPLSQWVRLRVDGIDELEIVHAKVA